MRHDGAMVGAKRGRGGVSQLDPVQARPKARYKRFYRRAVIGELDTIKRLTVGPVEAATLLGISRSSIYELLREGKLPAYKLGGKTIIVIDDIMKFLAHLPRYEPHK